MPHLFLAALDMNFTWNALPLVVAVSLVYAATRHEQMEAILSHAARVAAWIVGFMAIVFAVITAFTWLVRGA